MDSKHIKETKIKLYLNGLSELTKASKKSNLNMTALELSKETTLYIVSVEKLDKEQILAKMKNKIQN